MKFSSVQKSFNQIPYFMSYLNEQHFEKKELQIFTLKIQTHDKLKGRRRRIFRHFIVIICHL